MAIDGLFLLLRRLALSLGAEWIWDEGVTAGLPGKPGVDICSLRPPGLCGKHLSPSLLWETRALKSLLVY